MPKFPNHQADAANPFLLQKRGQRPFSNTHGTSYTPFLAAALLLDPLRTPAPRLIFSYPHYTESRATGRRHFMSYYTYTLLAAVAFIVFIALPKHIRAGLACIGSVVSSAVMFSCAVCFLAYPAIVAGALAVFLFLYFLYSVATYETDQKAA